MTDETTDLEKTLEEYKQQVATEMKASLTLDKDLIFVGRTARGYEIDFDARVEWGCMPTESLLISVAACLAIDVVSFIRKMKAEVDEFRVDISGRRNPSPPQYFKAVELVIRIKGKGIDGKKMDRAIGLSKNKYCSVLHTLRPDLDHIVRYEITEA